MNLLAKSIRFPRRAFRFAKRRATGKTGIRTDTKQRKEQLVHFSKKLSSPTAPSICAMSRADQNVPGLNASLFQTDFGIESHSNILDLVKERPIDAFFVNRCTNKDFVNLVNFLDAYGLEIPILVGDQFKCHSLIGYVPLMSPSSDSIAHMPNYFAKNYRISDPLLVQGSLYEGNRLVDCHQFLIKPDESKIINIRQELNSEDIELGMYYLEVFHPQLPVSTQEFRFFGLYRDKDSDYMAGSHSMPLGTWNNFGRDFSTLTRTFVPNMDGTIVRYLMSGEPAQPSGSTFQVETTFGKEIKFQSSHGQSAIEAIISSNTPAHLPHELVFDRISPVPTKGGQGFQTLWVKDRGFALWHDGDSVRNLRNRTSLTTVKTSNPKGDRTVTLPRQLADEQIASQDVSQSALDLYQRRYKYFNTVFPFLGHEYPDLQVVFDFHQWVTNLRDFEIHLYTNQGEHLGTRHLDFNGTLQTVNLNEYFADKVSEISQGYWTITADPAPQQPGQPPIQYPSDHMLFGFWGDSERIYDSVHSVATMNRVAFELHRTTRSDMARASGRIISRTKKFGPFIAQGEQTSWYWLGNVGLSQEKIDAQIKIRLFSTDGSEDVIPMDLPADHAVIIRADDILNQSKSKITEGTLWVESNDVNIGAMWFVQERDGKGFATDHLTGG